MKARHRLPRRGGGHDLELRITATTVEWHKGKRVAVHPRHGRERFSTLVMTGQSDVPCQGTATGSWGQLMPRLESAAIRFLK